MDTYQPRLKICGVTNVEDARLIGDSGADYCGVLVDVGFSERSLSLERAREVASAAGTQVVVLLCDPTLEAALEVVSQIKPYALQLLCRESPEFLRTLKSRVSCQVWKTIHLPVAAGQASAMEYVEAGADILLVDSVDTSEGFARMGGTGKVADWSAVAGLVEKVSVPVFLAGGIGPHNVENALIQMRPYGVDLCSGVEAFKGKKDPEKVRSLIKNFKAAQAKIEGGGL